ncbi:MAG: hypothetical protein LBK94_08625 [Prevotellaceae bacterium]|jgi:hypothetical protein|nr:hypothetical protein [Prevotellaceae bacterium]
MNGIRHLPLINGVEPSWANLVIAIAGVVETGITKIDYGDEQTIEDIYGAGQRPVARGYGNIASKCAITLLRSSVEAIRAASLTGRLQDIDPFNITVSFVPAGGNGTIVTHKIRNCQFTTDTLAASQGETKNETEFTLICSHIEWK